MDPHAPYRHLHVIPGLEIHDALHPPIQPPSAPPSPPRPATRLGPATWRQRLGSLTVLGLQPSPELLAIAMVYFVQGILGLADLASSFFFKDDLKLEPAAAAMLLGLANVPWVIKPLYGFISDALPLCGYRRRSYLCACGALGAASWALLAAWATSAWAAAALMTAASAATAFSDVVVDSIVVERSRGAPAATSGSLQSLCWISNYAGQIASAYFSGHLVQLYGTRFVFAITALFPLVVSVTALLVHEVPVYRSSPGRRAGRGGTGAGRGGRYTAVAADASAQGPDEADLLQLLLAQCRSLWQAMRKREILLPTVFIFMWQATPTSDTAMFYFYTNELGFTAEFLGWVALAAAVAGLSGVLLYNTCLKAVPLKKIMFWCMLLGAVLGSTQLILVSGFNRSLGLSDEIFVLGDNVIITALVNVSFMPVLVLAARLCPEGVEATLFATLMSVINGAGALGSALGAGLTSALGVSSTDFRHLFLLVALCTASGLLPMPFLTLLPADLEHEAEGKKADGGGGGGGGGALELAGGAHELQGLLAQEAAGPSHEQQQQQQLPISMHPTDEEAQRPKRS